MGSPRGAGEAGLAATAGGIVNCRLAVENARQEKGNLEGQWKKLTEINSAPPWPEKVKHEIQIILEQHSLHVKGVKDSNAALPSSLQALLTGLANGGGKKERQVVEFQFAGSFDEVRRSLDALSKSPLRVIPIALNMQEATLEA